MVGKEQAALEAALTLRERGIYVPAIRYPSVGRNRARLRVTLSASHTARDVRQLVSAVAGLSPSSCA